MTESSRGDPSDKGPSQNSPRKRRWWHDRERRRAILIALGIWLCAIAALLYHAHVYERFFFDDSFISLRYVKRFLQGRGLTWTDGERVEGYTNFLWVMVISAVGAFQPNNLINVARVLGVIATALAAGGVVFGNAPISAVKIVPVLAVALAIVATGPVGAWAMGGLEQALLAALVTWATVLAYRLLEEEEPRWRPVWLSGVLFGLAAVTRPDGVLFGASACAGLVVARGFDRRAFSGALRLIAPTVLFVSMHLAFRKLYYDAWVPNTYYAKVALTWERVRTGWWYLAHDPKPIAVWLLPVPLVLVTFFLDRRARKRMIFAGTQLLVWIAYVIVIGGDIAPEKRHVVPALFLLALLTAEALVSIAQRGKIGRAAAYALAPVFVVAVVFAQRKDSERRAAVEMTWYWSGKPLGVMLREAFADKDPLLAVDAAGSTPYYSELDSLDMLGLNDAYLTRHRPKDFGRGAVAHELGDGKYFLRRKPDLVMFHLPPGQESAQWRGGRQMQRSPEFRRLYKLVRFRTNGRKPENALLWVRAEDGRIGVRRTDGKITIPGFLFSAKDGPAAQLDGKGRLGTVVESGDEGTYALRALSPGNFRLDVEADGPVSITVTYAGTFLAAGVDMVMLELPNTPGAPLLIELEPGDEDAVQVRNVVLTRVP